MTAEGGGRPPAHPHRSSIRALRHDLGELPHHIGPRPARLAEILNYSKTHLGNIETANRMVPPGLSARLDAALATDGLFTHLYPLVRREAFPDRYRRFMELEAQAREIAEYAAHTVPGLLQTEAYARALLRVGQPKATTEEFGEKVSARLSRQELLHTDSPPRLWAVLDEAVIRRPAGGPATMCEQLDFFLPLTDAQHITVQVLPYAHGEHSCASAWVRACVKK